MKNRIKHIRKQKGLTMRGLAEAVGTSQQQIDRLEKSQRRLTVDWMSRLSKALQCEPFDLLSDFGHKRDGHTCRAKVIGEIVDNRAHFNTQTSYTIFFKRPKRVTGNGMFGLTVREGNSHIFPEGAELVFAELDHPQPVEDGKIVLCVSADDNNEKQYILKKTPVRDAAGAVKAVLVKSIRDE